MFPVGRSDGYGTLAFTDTFNKAKGIDCGHTFISRHPTNLNIILIVKAKLIAGRRFEFYSRITLNIQRSVLSDDNGLGFRPISILKNDRASPFLLLLLERINVDILNEILIIYPCPCH